MSAATKRTRCARRTRPARTPKADTRAPATVAIPVTEFHAPVSEGVTTTLSVLRLGRRFGQEKSGEVPTLKGFESHSCLMLGKRHAMFGAFQVLVRYFYACSSFAFHVISGQDIVQSPRGD